MDQPDMTMLLEALTASTSAERFGEFLAAPPAPDANTALPFSASFEMPLVAAHHPPQDPLSPPPGLFAGSPLDLNNVLPVQVDYPLPVSAVTGVSAASSRSDPAIRKKRARSNSPPTKPKPESVLAVTAAAAAAAAAVAAAAPVHLKNVSVTSDVSSLSPNDSPAVSRNFSDEKAKMESVKMESAKAEPTAAPSAGLHVAPSCSPLPSIHRSSGNASPMLPKSHTRKCREKVTKQFEHLLEVLPLPPKGVEVKHKAQILEYTIKVFRYLLLRRTSLQTEIALASRTALSHWMNASITAASAAMSRDGQAPQKPVPLSAVLEPFVGLYCVKKSWTYGEMWLVDHETNQASLASCVFNTDDDEVLRRFDSFATISRSRFGAPAQVKSGIISRVLATRRPEWLSDLSSDPRVFDRAALAREHGMSVATAVPVMLDANRCAGVLLFADVEPHVFSTGDLGTLLDYATVLGNLYVQYVGGFARQAPVHGPQGTCMEMKPSAGRKPFSCNPDRTNTGSQPAQDASCRPQGLVRPTDVGGKGIVRPSSETSYFGDAEFLGSH